MGEWLASKDQFIVFLFSLLTDSSTFDIAVSLLEEILGAKEDTFDLSLVPGFHALVQSMSETHLGIFCRVLAMVVFESDDRNGDEIGRNEPLFFSSISATYNYAVSIVLYFFAHSAQ